MLRNSRIAKLLTKSAGPLGLVGRGMSGTAGLVGKGIAASPGTALGVGLGTMAVGTGLAEDLNRAKVGLSPEYAQARRASGFRLPSLPEKE
jgi:hypothetical protein